MRKEVEVDDNHILLGLPIKLVKHGRKKDGSIDYKNKKIFNIRQVNWFYEWDKYSYSLAVFLMYINQVIESSIIPETLDELSDFREKVKTAITNRDIVSDKEKDKAFKAMCAICEFSGVSRRWMKKNFTIDDWIEIFLYFYLYNTIGKKKGLKDAYDQIGIVQSNFHQLKGKSSSSLKIVSIRKKSES